MVSFVLVPVPVPVLALLERRPRIAFVDRDWAAAQSHLRSMVVEIQQTKEAQSASRVGMVVDCIRQEADVKRLRGYRDCMAVRMGAGIEQRSALGLSVSNGSVDEQMVEC